MQKSRGKLLISNLLVYGLNQTLVILIPMIMLPIYSRILPDISVFGIGSLATTISSLCSSFAIFGMFDAAVRFAFDKTDNDILYQNRVCSTATIFMFCASIIMGAFLVCFREFISRIFYGNTNYTSVVVIAAGISIMTVWNTASLIPIRISNLKRLAIMNSFLKAVVTAIFTILLIFFNQYVIAIPLGTFFGLLFSWIITFIFIGRKNISIKLFSKSLLFNMLEYASPLMITLVSYWIYQSADKIMLSHLSDLTEVGIYSIGAKVGAVSGVIQTAFASGWSYFAFSTMNDDDQIQLISEIFRLGLLITCTTAFLVTAFSYPVFNIMFNNENYLFGSYICTPLFAAPLFLTVMQVIGTQLLISKNTRLYSLAQICGASVNVFLNWMLIPFFGSRGAAVATYVGYIIPLLIFIIYIGKNKKIKVNANEIFVICVTLMIVTYSTLFVRNWIMNLCIGICGMIFMVISFKKDILALIRKTVELIRNIFNIS